MRDARQPIESCRTYQAHKLSPFSARASSPAKHGGRGRNPLPYSRASDNPAAEFSAMVVRVSGGLCILFHAFNSFMHCPSLPHSWLRHSMAFSCVYIAKPSFINSGCYRIFFHMSNSLWFINQSGHCWSNGKVELKDISDEQLEAALPKGTDVLWLQGGPCSAPTS